MKNVALFIMKVAHPCSGQRSSTLPPPSRRPSLLSCLFTNFHMFSLCFPCLFPPHVSKACDHSTNKMADPSVCFNWHWYSRVSVIDNKRLWWIYKAQGSARIQGFNYNCLPWTGLVFCVQYSAVSWRTCGSLFRIIIPPHSLIIGPVQTGKHAQKHSCYMFGVAFIHVFVCVCACVCV